MRRLAALLVLAVAVPTALSQPATTASASAPADPVAESRRIDAEIKRLRESTPVMRELDALGKRITAIELESREKEKDLRTKVSELAQSAAYRDYEKQVRELESQRYDKWELERKAIGERARQLYAARHDELRKLARPDVPEARKLGLDVLSYPRVDGSTSTHPLSVIVAARVLNVPYAWFYPQPSGYYWRDRPDVPSSLYLSSDGLVDFGYPISGAMGYNPRNMEFNLAASRVAAKPADHAPPAAARIAVMINSLLAANTTTHDAYVNLIEGKCDLNLTAREPSESERKLAQEKNVTLALKPIAKDALVFIVNAQNPTTNLTTQQVRAIYEAKITTWQQLDPAAKDLKQIRPLRRDKDSGSRELFDALVMKGQQLPEPEHKYAAELYSSSMSGPYNRVTQEPNALGYSVWYYEHFMAMSPYTRTLAIDGVEPNADTLAAGKYPFIAPIYVAYRDNTPADSPAMKLLTWLLSPEGQAVLREAGYVPIGK